MKERSGSSIRLRSTDYGLPSKKGQMKISFGMIFSIILVISFLGFGFFAIQKFLSIQENIIMKKFIDDFQEDIDKMWKSTTGSKEVEYVVPRKLTSVCFEFSPYYNTLVYSGEIFEEYTFKKIDIEKTLGVRDSVCTKAKDNKISFYLGKQFGEADVTIRV